MEDINKNNLKEVSGGDGVKVRLYSGKTITMDIPKDTNAETLINWLEVERDLIYDQAILSRFRLHCNGHFFKSNELVMDTLKRLPNSDNITLMISPIK